MKLSIGIIGLPNVGKSTLFKILTKREVNIANYPFVTIDPNVGVVAVPDERLGKVAELSKAKDIVPAVVEFYDIAGLVKGAYRGHGLGNQFLAHIRECQAIVQIVRCFKQSDIVHVEGRVDPLRDIEIIETELILKDLETVKKRLDKAESDAKGGKKEAVQLRNVLHIIKAELEKENLLWTNHVLICANKKIVDELNLLTIKPQIFLLNGKLEDITDDLRQKIKELDADYIIADLANIEALPDLIKKAYQVLNLITFFTIVGENEARAWAIEGGSNIVEAAGLIHTDFARKFIRAEVINWQKLLEADGWNEAKQKGRLRLEGKDYIVEDGDVMVVRHG